MTLLTYQIFKTVSEAGSFHKAADLLGLTPSAISHAVSGMEKELGFSVFTRGKAGVSLTSSGSRLLPYINAVLNSDESLQQAVSEMNGLQQGTVKVGAFSSVCTNWMPDIITSFGKMYPAVEIELFQGTYDDVVYWIKNGVVDFGFLSTSSAKDLPIEPFYRDPLLCIVPGDYEKEEAGESMTISEMSRRRFVVQRESTDADIQNYLKQNHLDISTRYAGTGHDRYSLQRAHVSHGARSGQDHRTCRPRTRPDGPCCTNSLQAYSGYLQKYISNRLC